jgi:hypothetical protein
MNKLKFGPALLASTLTGCTGCLVLYRALARYGAGLLPPFVIWTLSFLVLPASILYAVMHYMRRRQTAAGQHDLLAPFNVILVFLLSFDLYSFGWQKIFHLQMVVPLGVLDLPFNSFDSETLTWAYFRRSYPFTVAIAIAQMSGAILLLFRRTRLLGLITLAPVLLNIILIDICYHLHTWVLLHAIVLSSGIIYLLCQYRSGLTEFFFKVSPGILQWSIPGKAQRAISIVILLLPLVLLLTYRFPDKHPRFTGKYAVKNLYINGTRQEAGSFRDSVLTTVYMDLQDEIVLEFNHYNNRYIGTYHYDDQRQHLHAQWRYPGNFHLRFDGSLQPLDDQRNLQFEGVLGNDSVRMQLISIPEPG